MTWQPILSVPLLLGLGLGLVGLTLWQVFRPETNRVGWWRRLGITGLMILIGFGPSVQERVPDALLTNAEVYFVVDRTGSMAAQDYGREGQTRLTGVAADINALTRVIPAAQYAILTFDSQAARQLPLTSDARAVRAWVSSLRQEVTRYSAGSAIDRPLETLEATLSRAAAQNPQNVRIVFIFSDGENTRGSGSDPDAIESYASVAHLVDGGAVLGYGTPEGGQMLQYTGVGEPAEGDWIIDSQTQAPAISRIDETQLRQVAEDLGVTYQHRFEPSALDALVENIKISDAAGDGRRDAVVNRGLYWALALALLPLLAWEGWDVLRQVPGRKGTALGNPDPLAGSPPPTPSEPETEATPS